MKKYISILSIIVLFFGAVSGHSEGLEEKITYSLNSYLDNNRGLIITNKLGVVKAIKENYAVSANAGVDAITAASPSNNKSDTSSTERSRSYRYYASLSGIYDDRENNVNMGVYMSEESDYSGNSVFVNYVRQLNNLNTSISIALSTLSDEWKLDGLPRNDRKGTQLDLSVTQFLSPTMQIQAGYTNIISKGYLASPYRFIEQGAPLLLIEEKLPSSRKGDAFSLRLVKLLNRPTSVNLSYRYYKDDWEIKSHTINMELYRDLSDTFTLGGRLRYYTQSDTSYTKNITSYSGSEKYIPIDYKYSAFNSYMVGANVIYKLTTESLDSYDIKGSLDYYKTSDNDFIKYWYGKNYIDAWIFSLSVDYLY